MRALIFERIKADSYVQRAIRQKNKKFLLWLSLFAAVVLLFTLLLCHLASFAPHHWGIALAIAAAVAVVPFLVFFFTRKPKIHVGRITRIEETHKLIPEEGDEILRRWQPRRAEVETHQILVAFTDEEGEAEVLFLPPSYEKLLSVGDVLLSHSALPYPAHLSCPTASLCMHCGSVQAAENETCSTCGAPLYSVFTLKK